jgi:hypothetical protein
MERGVAPMSLYDDYVADNVMFLALTGYTPAEFATLVPAFEIAFFTRMQTYCLDGTPRTKRAYTEYKNSPLPTIEDKLFFILCYFKTYPIQAVQAALFRMTQPKVQQWLDCLTPALEQALAALHELPARDMATLELEPAPTVYFHDGTECPICRPSKPMEQRQYYSGKKKRHTVKYNLISTLDCKIRFLSAMTEGKKHDKKLADECSYRLPPGSRLVQDTGFQGFTLAEVHILQPQKKPRGTALSAHDKFCNRWISRLRMRAEHAIGGVKRCRIAKDRLRNWKVCFREKVFAICCGLHNFRLNFRPWRYPPIQLHLFVEF